MRTDTPRPDDSPALIARRERLRALTEAVITTEETRPKPETYVDTARAMQAAALADRVLTRLSDDEAEPVVPQARQRLRVHADRLLDILEALPKPDSFRMSISALRCILMADRLLVQIYSAPKPVRTPPVSAPEIKSVAAPARKVPTQPGARIAPERVDWQAATAFTAQINAITRHAARKGGKWPDQTRFDEADPDYYAISALFGPLELGLDAKEMPDGAYDEIPGPDSFPWWLIHKTPARNSG